MFTQWAVDNARMARGSQRCQVIWPSHVVGCAYIHTRQIHIADQSRSQRYTFACTLTPHAQKTHQTHTTVSFDNQVSGEVKSKPWPSVAWRPVGPLSCEYARDTHARAKCCGNVLTYGWKCGSLYKCATWPQPGDIRV